jgi:hypothetical protein
MGLDRDHERKDLTMSNAATTETAANFANRIAFSDIFPFEIVRCVNATTIDVRAMDSELAPDWKPEMVAGGFSAHCTNQATQRWIFASNPEREVVRIRFSKRYKQWRDAGGRHYCISTTPRRFHDYNF